MNRLLALELQVQRQRRERTTLPDERSMAQTERNSALRSRCHRAPGAGALARRRKQGRRLSKGLYGTGEHVIAGEDTPDLPEFGSSLQPVLQGLSLSVGMPTAVQFTYGDIMTMGDLYADFDQMNGASASELRRLRALIRKSRAHYHGKIFGGASRANTSDAEWQDATGDRYVELALDNSTHFAPSDPAIVAPATGGLGGRDHAGEWFRYHVRAANAVRSNPTDEGLQTALAINAFGDHFLTDAFASGHLFNKHDVAGRFSGRLMNAGGALTSAGETFFDETARLAWRGDLRAAFSRYETVERLILGIARPNISSQSRFAAFLRAVQEAEPGVIANGLVAKVIHDKLNKRRGGLEVTNALGDRWHLFGDGTLKNDQNLRQMRKAVARSIYNIAYEAPSVVDDAPLYQWVWQYTPRPTDASKQIIKALVDRYTDPASAQLHAAAAEMLSENYQMLLDQAVERGQLKLA